jgi:2-dehydro-3-deoxyphosphogluconate aldolase / (4S)-4-hydroxy-2-oxoglutarate aldolase
MDIARFRKLPVMGILRGITMDTAGPVIETIISSGLETVEIAMNTDGAALLIKKAMSISNGRLMIGAGTVLNLDTLKSALDAGATFIVTPTIIEDVAEYCAKNVIPLFPGALTPTEIYAAWNAGATMVKVFPAGVFGPAYIREVKTPFNHIELMACGGVTPENIREYFKSGASAVAFGASVFRQDWLAKRDFASIQQAIERLTVVNRVS